MTIQVFRMWSEQSPVPLTVFASDLDDAKLTFMEWVVIHEPAWSRQPARILRLSDKGLSIRPQLADAARSAAELGISGIAYWLGHERGWVARPTFDDRVGEIAPYQPSVRCYMVEADEGDEALVFAHDIDEAVRLYIAWYQDANGGPCNRFTTRRFSRWLLTGDQVALREEMDLGIIGISGWSLANGWGILV